MSDQPKLLPCYGGSEHIWSACCDTCGEKADGEDIRRDGLLPALRTFYANLRARVSVISDLPLTMIEVIWPVLDDDAALLELAGVKGGDTNSGGHDVASDMTEAGASSNAPSAGGVPENTGSAPASSLRRGVKGCARCGEDHEPMQLFEMKRPVDSVFTHWAMCPNGGGPILYDLDPKQAAEPAPAYDNAEMDRVTRETERIVGAAEPAPASSQKYERWPVGEPKDYREGSTIAPPSGDPRVFPGLATKQAAEPAERTDYDRFRAASPEHAALLIDEERKLAASIALLEAARDLREWAKSRPGAFYAAVIQECADRLEARAKEISG